MYSDLTIVRFASAWFREGRSSTAISELGIKQYLATAPHVDPIAVGSYVKRLVAAIPGGLVSLKNAQELIVLLNPFLGGGNSFQLSYSGLRD